MSVNAYDPATDSLILLAAGKKDSRSTLTVTTELPGLIGETVTVTDNKETLTSTFSNDGRAVFKLNNTGTYTATCKTYSDSIINENPGMTLELTVGPEIVSWSGGTDAEIVDLVTAADRGDIDLYDDAGWRIGDERTVSLSAMAGNIPSMQGSTLGGNQPAQDVTMVLVDRGHFELTTAKAGGRTFDDFVVALKNPLDNTGKMASLDDSSLPSTNPVNGKGCKGSWDKSERRTWCNSIFKNAVPSTLLPIFKQFKVITANDNYDSAGTIVSNDYFALFAHNEFFGNTGYSSITTPESNATSQLEYYKTSENRVFTIKNTDGNAATNPSYWIYATWFRSPGKAASGYEGRDYRYCIGAAKSSSNGSSIVIGDGTGQYFGIWPFGCI